MVYIYTIYTIFYIYIYKHTNNCTHAKIPGKGNMYIHTDTQRSFSLVNFHKTNKLILPPLAITGYPYT